MPRPSGPVRAAASQAAAVGPRMRERRRDLGLSQQQLADAVEVSRQTIVSIESGNYAPSVFLALKIAGTLATTVERLWAAPGGVVADVD